MKDGPVQPRAAWPRKSYHGFESRPLCYLSRARRSSARLAAGDVPWLVLPAIGNSCIPRPPGRTASGGRGLLGRAGVFRRALLRLLRAVVAADGDFLAADLDLDAAVLDFPVAHGTRLRLHEMAP